MAHTDHEDEAISLKAHAKVKAALDSIVERVTFSDRRNWVGVGLKGLARSFAFDADTGMMKRDHKFGDGGSEMSDYHRRIKAP